MKKHLRHFILLFFIIFSVISTYSQSWLTETVFPGTKGSNRIYPISQVVGSKGYVGLGFSEVGDPPYLFDDFWEYNFITKQWTQRSNYPGGATSQAISFVIGTNIYVGLAGPGFYEYNTLTNTWRSLPTIPMFPERQGAIAFTINGKGYVSCGRGNRYEGTFSDDDENKKDLWCFDPGTETWTRKADIPSLDPVNDPSGIQMRRRFPIGFSLNNKGYVGGGVKPNGTFISDFWEYDPTIDAWANKGNIPLPLGYSGHGLSVSLTMCDKGYIIGGGTTTNYETYPLYTTNQWYQYNPATNVWTQGSPVYPSPIFGAAGFSYNGSLYVGLDGKSFYKIALEELNGPQLICSTGSFSISNLFAGSSVTWTSSDPTNLPINSATGDVTRLNSFNGQATITGTLSGTCSFSYSTTVTIGTPTPNFTGPSYNLCDTKTGSRASATYTISNPLPGLTYSWEVLDGGSVVMSVSGNSIVVKGFQLGAGSYVLRARSNGCATSSSWNQKNIFVDNCSGSRATNVIIYPNPSTEELYVTLSDSIIQDIDQAVELKVIDQNQQVRYSAESSGTNLTIPVSSLPSGNYILIIKYKDAVIRKQIWVKK